MAPLEAANLSAVSSQAHDEDGIKTWAERLQGAAAPAAAAKSQTLSRQAALHPTLSRPVAAPQRADAAAGEAKPVSDVAVAQVATWEDAQPLTPDGKFLARARFQRQARCGGSHTLRAKRLSCRTERKGLDVRLVAGGGPAPPRRLRFASTLELAEGLGGSCEPAVGAAAQRARRAGEMLYVIRAPGDSGEATYAVLQRRANPSARTAYPKSQWTHFPGRADDWNFSKQIYEARTKSSVQRQEISEGLAAIAGKR